MNYQLKLSEEKNYFLVPEMPTPNGRMHLGHIAGPYLKMDIIKRKAKRGGGLAFIASGSDVYESYVELKASQLKTDENEVANHFHELIVQDFEALNIEFDSYINPLDEKYNSGFILRHKQLMKQLIDLGVVVEKEEIFPYDVINKRFLSGCWIKGVCPNCKSNTGSYLCENCGTHYKPIDLFEESNYPDSTYVKGKSLYLKLDKESLVKRIKEIETTFFEEIINRYIELQGPYIRLTTPQRTGIKWDALENDGQVIFTYSALLFFSIYCADLCRDAGMPEHPFDPESSFVNIASFGIDNVVPYLAGVLGGGMALKKLRPFDYLLSNYFYYLNGEKFSTSRLHVIWGSDIVNKAQVQSDAVRYYLVKQNPEFETQNFDVSAFIETINKDLYGIYNQVITNAFAHLTEGKAYEINNQLISELEKCITSQNKNVEPPAFNFSAALNAIEAWIKYYNGLTAEDKALDVYWWLKGFSFLIYPVMPVFATSIWNRLSTTPEITKADFFEDNTATSTDLSGILFKEISYANLEKCLPQTLKEKIN